MRLSLLALSFLFASSFAWLLPDRCDQNNHPKRRRRSKTTIHAPSVYNIQDVADEQHQMLQEQYADYQFIGVPVRSETCNSYHNPFRITRKEYAANNCRFHTSRPRLLDSVACDTGSCKLSRIVTAQNTYTALEGYNWGAKVSSKFSIAKVFEIGGEASGGETYSCAHTIGTTIANTIECSVPTNSRGHLQLFSVKTDLKCDFGVVTLKLETRNGKQIAKSRSGFLSGRELRKLESSASTKQVCYSNDLLVDTNKVPDSLIGKLRREFPDYNPYTDLVLTGDDNIDVVYFKKTSMDEEFSKVIPFTNEDGDAAHQYACMFVPF